MAKISAFVMSLLMLAATPAGAQDALGLADCLRLAADNSAGVKSAGAYREWADESRTEALRRYFPSVEVNLTHQPKLDFFGRPVEEDDVYDTELKAVQPLYSGELSAGREQAKQRAEKARTQESDAALTASLEAVEAYYQALSASLSVQERQGLSQRAREAVDNLREAESRGLMLREDLLAAQSQQLDLEYKLSQDQGKLKEARWRLAALMGMPPGRDFELRYQRPSQELPADPQSILASAMTDNAALQKAKAEEDLLAAELDMLRAGRGNRLNLEGSYGLEGDDFPGDDKRATVLVRWEWGLGPLDLGAYYGYEHQYENQTAFFDEDKDLQQKGLSLKLPQGWPAARLAEIAAAWRQAAEKRREDTARLRSRILSLWQQYSQAAQRAELATKRRDLATERLEVAQARRRSGGTFDPTAELERLVELAQAKADLIEAQTEMDRVAATLWLLSGHELKLEDQA